MGKQCPAARADNSGHAIVNSYTGTQSVPEAQERMKIAIVGAGAMGSLFAGYLAKTTAEVWIYDIWKEHIEAINKDGLCITNGKKSDRVRLDATSDPKVPGIADLLIIFVKHADTRQAVQDARCMVGPSTAVLTLQNGIGNVEIIQGIIPDDQILFGFTTLPSELLGPGRINDSAGGKGATYFWPLTGEPNLRIKRIASVFNEAGIHTEISAEIELFIWKKLVVNCVWGTLSAVTRLKVGDLMNLAPLLIEGLITEIVHVAQTKGIALEKQTAWDFLQKVGEEGRDHVPSMLADILNSRKTEINALNGAVALEGERLGIATPFNSTMCGLIKAMEESYGKRLS